ncbi:MAG TPA: M14 family zinc carboxypeptidase, partial [Candidatus Sulfotelmatobacter sp.]|nr:M14 family zinc carboxypeptidase [Candidatus Sulfotelmatobacter sp.]
MSPYRPRRAAWHALAIVPVLAALLAPMGTPARTAARTTAPAGADPVLASLGRAATPPTTVTIDRVAGADRYATAVAISQRLYPAPGAPVVYLASGTGFADAASASPAAAVEHGVVLLTPQDALPEAVAAELTRLAPQRVVVVGGTASVSDAVLAQAATASGVTPERISGADRYATSLAVVADAFPSGPVDTLFLAAGSAFPDALSAAPAAGVGGAPLLLTPAGALRSDTAAEISHLAPAHVVIVGGTASISAAVATAVAKLGPTVERVAGIDRYGTAAAVAARFLPAATTDVLASGLAFPDALAAGPLAASLDAPLRLVLPDVIPTVVATRDAVIATRPSTLLAVGGQGSVRDAVANELAAWSEGTLVVPPPQPDYPSGATLYHNYTRMEVDIDAVQAAYPDLVHLFSIGKSYQGRDIWAAEVSGDVTDPVAKPEVLIDGLHHSLERLALEQSLYALHMLTHDYSTDPTVKQLVDTRRIWIIFAVNPDGLEYDLTGSPYREWRKNRQPNSGTSAVGTDINRNYGYRWGCCGGSSGSAAAWNYRGPAAFSTPEAKAVRDFVLSRVVGGVQQIKTHVTFHTDGELILWPYGYTKTDIPSDMTADDHATFVAMGKAMAKTDGYTAEQSSDLYVTDGDEIDWLYGVEHIFSFTFEL